MEKIQAQAPISLNNCSRENILDYFENAWQLEDMLLKSIIKEETFYCASFIPSGDATSLQFD